MPTSRPPEPGTWWSLEDVVLRADGTLLYTPGTSLPTRVDARWRHDEGARAAIEAFTALPLADLAEAIGERLARLRLLKRPISDTWYLLGRPELRDFLMTFGPVLAGFGPRFAVRNRQAEGYQQRAKDAEFELRLWRDGLRPTPVRSRRRTRPWMVSFEGWAQGDGGTPPDVVEVPHDYGHSEPLFRLRCLQDQLTEAVDLADALAVAQHWTADRTPKDRIRATFLARLGDGPVRLDGSTEWRRIVPDVPVELESVVIAEDGAHPAPGAPGSSTLARSHPWRVDWMTAGRMLLADMIGRHVRWAQLYIAVDERGRLRSEWRTRSLDEVMYMQLMEHVERTPRKKLVDLPYWPLPRCDYCRAVILGRHPRRPDSRFANRWHRGRCRKAGQRREERSRA